MGHETAWVMAPCQPSGSCFWWYGRTGRTMHGMRPCILRCAAHERFRPCSMGMRAASRHLHGEGEEEGASGCAEELAHVTHVVHRLLLRRWGVAVLDEGHKIRNPDSEVALVAKQVGGRTAYLASGNTNHMTVTGMQAGREAGRARLSLFGMRL